MQSVPSKRVLIFGLVLSCSMLMGAGGLEDLNGDATADLGKAGGPKGLNPAATADLINAGVDKYLGDYTPVASEDVGDGWTKHTFDPDGGNGPICIAGTPFSAFTRQGNPSRLLIFEQGGGACWQGFYNCNVLAEEQEPPAPREGIWDFDSRDNPFADYSIVYMPYCDGSVFSGDNDVFDPAFGKSIGVPDVQVRFHRGFRNQSAGMDLAKAMFPHARRITVAGSSAGGVGVAGFAPFLVRLVYGNQVHLTVFNDAGPVTVNPAAVDSIAARAADWRFGQFYPASCTDCDDMGDATAVIRWRLDNDSTIREAFYETDGDFTNRFFLELLGDPVGFRDLIVTGHGLLNAAHPNRYKRFIVAGDISHTALQTPLFYSQDANGVFLNEWTADFLVPRPFWMDIVEDAIP
ncbi:MAG: pectinacetylesterase family protein [Gammaproteobacteria bacterium]|nr:pectinacetylesterase family protein [Gammaproteobacteria bacterium]